MDVDALVSQRGRPILYAVEFMKNPPNFSVIIPTYMRPKQIAACLKAFTRLDYPRDRFEIIVVNDGGVIPLEPIIRPFSRDIEIRLLHQPNAGPAAARNYGAIHAKFEYLAFTDDDCRPAPDWLHTLSVPLTGHRVLVGGQTVNALSDNHYSSASQVILDVAYLYHNPQPDHARFFASNNLALPARPFQALGGFDPAFTTSEDRDLCDRWLRSGYRLVYAPQALVYHAHELTFSAFWRQHSAYGRGAWRYHRARALRGDGPFRPDLTFYRSLFRRPFSRGLSTASLRLFGLVLLSQIANAAGFFDGRLSQLNPTYICPDPRQTLAHLSGS